LKAKNSNWYLESGYSKHMKGNKKKFFLIAKREAMLHVVTLLKFLLQKGIANSREAKMVYTFQ
jgi:hypothetical protein